MLDLNSMDPRDSAEKLARALVKPLDEKAARQKNLLDTRQKSLTEISKAMTNFKSSLTALNRSNDGVLKNSVTTSEEHIATITANSTAVKGSYDLVITKLASASQIELDGLDDAAVDKAKGIMTLKVGKQKLDIDMSKMHTLADLQQAINAGGKDAPAITASMVRLNGKVSLILSSDETGSKNQLTVIHSPANAAIKEKELHKAEDAEFTFNGQSGKSGTNHIENVIDGVTLDLNQINTAAKPLQIKVATDAKSSKEQVQKLVDAYNKLQDTVDASTVIGSKTAARGIFAGDSAISSMDRNLKSLLRTQIAGKNITDFGISADKTGHLVVDSEKLDKALSKDPKALTAFFNGKDGLTKKMENALKPYLSKTDGAFKLRQDSIDRDQRDLQKNNAAVDKKYQDAFDRYLAQYTRLQATMSQMNQTLASLNMLDNK